MARPNKTGLDYFPLDVDFFEEEKILAISGEFAVKGEIIALRLLCEIYRNGYFVEYSELLKNKLARLGGLSGGLVDEVVGKLVKYGFFEGSLFSGENILTSKGIQKRFVLASKRRENSLCCQYCLINDINVCKNYVSSDINVCKNSQSKRESKEKENKEKSADADAKKNPGGFSHVPDEGYLKFNAWIKEKCPFCANPKNFSRQITEDEFSRLINRFSKKQLMEVIEQIENRKDLRKKYDNLYRTALNWAKRDGNN